MAPRPASRLCNRCVPFAAAHIINALRRAAATSKVQPASCSRPFPCERCLSVYIHTYIHTCAFAPDTTPPLTTHPTCPADRPTDRPQPPPTDFVYLSVLSTANLNPSPAKNEQTRSRSFTHSSPRLSSNRHDRDQLKPPWFVSPRSWRCRQNMSLFTMPATP